MIYTPIITEQGFKRFHDIPGAYFACCWVEGEDIVKQITKEFEPLTPPTYPSGPLILDGIASLEINGYDYFLQAIKDMGKIIPKELLKD